VQQDPSRRWYEYAYLNGVDHLQHRQENMEEKKNEMDRV
jgi:hypothetical protein